MQRTIICIAVNILFGVLVRGDVSVDIERMTFDVALKPQGPRGAKSAQPEHGVYSIRGAEAVIEPTTVDVIKINNGLIEAWVCPAFGARLLRAFDIKTGVDYFNWTGDWNMDYLGFGSGGVEPSFPFFEHGVFLRQRSGYRIVEKDDGAITVAMDMRFTHHQYPRDSKRYGRFTEESLNVMVTVSPESTLIEYRMRRENPTPLPRGGRLWNCATYNFDAPSKEVERENRKTKQMETVDVIDREAVKERYQIIYPACWVVDHGPTTVHSSPHWSNPSNWDVSHFAIDAPYGLMGVYDHQQKVNYLRTNDPEGSPAAKLYAAFWGWRPSKVMIEIWGGKGVVFEKPQPLFPAYVPVEAVNHYVLVQGIGPVTFANNEAAVAVDGTEFELITYRKADITVHSGGKAVLEGETGPYQPLRGSFDGNELVVMREGIKILQQHFPLKRPVPKKDEEIPERIQALFADIKKYGGQSDRMLEMEQIMNNEGAPTALDAIQAAASASDDIKPERALSLARTCYRVGAFDEAEKMASKAPGAEADFVLGLLALERGEKSDFGKAGPEADYLRALAKIASKEKAAALELVNRFLQHNPAAYRPRLARAYWAGDLDKAVQLSAENPGSPEALMVRKLLGDESVEKDLALLLENNPEARAHVDQFRIEITQGKYMPLRRYGE